MDTVDPSDIKIKVLANDLLLAPAVPDAPLEKPDEPWAPHFCPREFVRENKGITTEAFALDPTELRKLGVWVSEM